ncbi:MAG: ClpXP protease specificity-enhancing factor [Gammaproteobacteria bacterium]|jgi:stringent starvation protein B|nr:ClpXP protease specificity-enhancing factor [Gammaproteobacteria bacterium]MCP4880703.1 ClpXP protease specificity-enhancing factor [Gammaproteobacteria bacterium]MDP6165148.1 ClpXP protease specificity-enhancing factor [Gammaproteobacteria bacterium]
MSITPSRPYLIRALYEWILDNDDVPYLVVDATIKDVMVPEQFISDGQIILNIGTSAVQALDLADEAVSFSARFGGVPMQVYVPTIAVKAIYAKGSGQGMGFGFEPGIPDPEAPPPEAKPEGRPALKVVK